MTRRAEITREFAYIHTIFKFQDFNVDKLQSFKKRSLFVFKQKVLVRCRRHHMASAGNAPVMLGLDCGGVVTIADDKRRESFAAMTSGCLAYLSTSASLGSEFTLRDFPRQSYA
jgi:hypothetical protein